MQLNTKIRIITTLLFVCWLFPHCNKSPLPTNNPNDLIGTWDLIGITSVQVNETYQVPKEEIEADPLTYIIYSDWTGMQFYQGTTLEVQWSADETTLVVISDVGVVIATYTYTVDSENLRLSFPMGNNIIVTHQLKRQSNRPTHTTLKYLEQISIEQWRQYYGDVLFTGAGAFTGIEVGPANENWDGYEIKEKVYQAPNGDPCNLASRVAKPDGFFCSCDGIQCEGIFTVGRKFQSSPPNIADAKHNVFWDIHKIIHPSLSLLHYVNLNNCTISCIQEYSINDMVIGKYLITYTLNRDNVLGKTIVTVNKTPMTY